MKLSVKRPQKYPRRSQREPIIDFSVQGESGVELTRNLSWIPNIGAGYRFEVQNRMNLRIDHGIGKDSQAVYFSFNEAF